jgi:glycosyltransferase involved in cell wall biosynthesis
MGRVVVDLTTCARWSGPPVGIVRVEQELALWALKRRPDAVFVFFDPSKLCYRRISPNYLESLISGVASISGWGLPDPTRRRKRRSDAIPRPIYAVVQGRRTVLLALEHVRLSSRKPWVRTTADKIQRSLMTRRHRPHMLDEEGNRRDFVSTSIALAEEFKFLPTDTLICAGSGWTNSNIDAIEKLKINLGFRLVVVCYDMIPIQFPAFYKPHDVEGMRHYWSRAFSCADLVVVNSSAVARDAGQCAVELGVKAGPVAICPLGANPSEMMADDAEVLPDLLEEGRYALFVSTIEPRKGHELLYRTWLRLLEAGVPQANRFKLVFVGRPGWLMETFEAALRDDVRIKDSLIVLPRVSDAKLDLLYRRAAFCVYPSAYEGYGLPLVEAFARGKAVLTSGGGALAEVAGEFSPQIDPRNEDLWFETLKSWIENPAARAPYEALIAERFRHPTWDEVAARFFAIVEDPPQAEASAS